MNRRESDRIVTTISLLFEIFAQWCASSIQLTAFETLPSKLIASNHHNIDRIVNASSASIILASPTSTRNRCDVQYRHAY
ncbi:hypothetical protein BS47DRAFT_1355474 [Hydnum rufescens UP504]|uniref:Uncharacterized protein n=1 Tax=Hydnum rufescens UP504 TaxID=1448309 RepID=A0A9P6AFX8_9AGAM|nr:hypothetical protein BS47DRAFT_1355474 [Hydnum rufescens UP504]